MTDAIVAQPRRELELLETYLGILEVDSRAGCEASCNERAIGEFRYMDRHDFCVMKVRLCDAHVQAWLRPFSLVFH